MLGLEECLRGARRVGGIASQPLDLLGAAHRFSAVRVHRIRKRIVDGRPLWDSVVAHARGGPTE